MMLKVEASYTQVAIGFSIVLCRCHFEEALSCFIVTFITVSGFVFEPGLAFGYYI